MRGIITPFAFAFDISLKCNLQIFKIEEKNLTILSVVPLSCNRIVVAVAILIITIFFRGKIFDVETYNSMQRNYNE